MTVFSIPKTLDGYRLFLKAKSLPAYRFTGHTVTVPDEYAYLLNSKRRQSKVADYTPPEWMFDYQAAITQIAIRKRRFCVFATPGMGKTAIFLDFCRHAIKVTKRPALIVSPLMIIKQTISECRRFFGDDYPIEQIAAKDLQQWMRKGKGVGITNYEAIRDDLEIGKIRCLVIEESSSLKSHYGKWGTKLIELGRGIEWKMACTGTPAPNDRIEYANHAIFMDAFPTVNSFLARFFVNRGQTGERWELKPHALGAFYRALSAWSIFLNDPATYGWKDNAGGPPPIHVHVQDVPLTDQQSEISKAITGELFSVTLGGIMGRSKMGQLAKGRHNGTDIGTHKPEFIRSLVDSFGDRSTIIWCKYNAEQETIARLFPDGGNVAGDTPMEERERIIDSFKAGRIKQLISKPKILGFGQNLQVCTRMVFSGIEDSYEQFVQSLKRANRYGSTEPLEAYIPVTEIERPMVDNVLRKARMVDQDTIAQERIFKEYGYGFLGL